MFRMSKRFRYIISLFIIVIVAAQTAFAEPSVSLVEGPGTGGSATGRGSSATSPASDRVSSANYDNNHNYDSEMSPSSRKRDRRFEVRIPILAI